MGIFKDFGSAFAAMYDDTVAITGTRASGATVRGSFAACVFPISSDDPFADMDVATTRKRISVVLPRSGDRAWNFSAPPQIGDEIEYRGEKYAVDKIADFGSDDFTVEARSL